MVIGSDNTITHTDIKKNGWIDRFLPPAARPYAYLARFDRPIGVWLLLLPSLWAIFLSAGGAAKMNMADWKLVALFALGAIVMRAAGCVINDIWDRDLDKGVERTAQRPLAAGAVNVWQASVFLAVLLTIGLFILLRLQPVAILLGILSVPLIITYPLMKRVTWWPQAFLGLTFNFGALIGWAAVTGILEPAALLLYAAGFFWTLGYDTIYAHQDKEDDILMGIKSLARKLGDQSPKSIFSFYTIAAALLIFAFISAGAGGLSVAALTFPVIYGAYRLKKWQPDNNASSLDMFRENRNIGLLVLLAALI